MATAFFFGQNILPSPFVWFDTARFCQYLAEVLAFNAAKKYPDVVSAWPDQAVLNISTPLQQLFGWKNAQNFNFIVNNACFNTRPVATVPRPLILRKRLNRHKEVFIKVRFGSGIELSSASSSS